MKRFKKVLSITLVISLLLVAMAPGIFAEETTEKTITILTTSDLHGRIYPHDYALDVEDSDAGLAKIAAVVKEIRATSENVLLIDNGDTTQDNSAELFNDRDIHPMVEAMNTIGYDIWTIGNHEFNFGLDVLNNHIDDFQGDVLTGNIKKISTGEYFVQPYVIKDIDGVKVAVVGMLPPHVPRWEASNPDHFEDLEFLPVSDATETILAELEGQYDVLVGAYHVGPDGEYGDVGLNTIAENFPQFDVLIGGHSHGEINETVNGVLILEPKRYGNRISKVDIQVNQTSEGYEVVSVEGENINTKAYEADSDILEQFTDVHETAVEYANTVIGTITADFIERADYITGEDEITTMPTSQIVDTSVMDLINTVQLYYSEADISSAALFNFGSNLKAGDFKKKDVAFIYKYDNTLMGVNITGKNLLAYMEWSVNYYNAYKDGDITISFNPDIRGYNYDMFAGCTYEIDLSQETGNRIKNVMIKGMPLDEEAVYKLAVNNYRFGTIMGLGLVTEDDLYYDSVSQFPEIPDGRIRDLIIKYSEEVKDGSLTPEVDNNWSIVGVDLTHPLKDEILEKVISGEITIPRSEDGRTANVKSLNVYELAEQGIITLPKPEVQIYIVVPGDVLWKIAQSYGTTWKELAEYNNLANPNLILPNQEIMIPVQ